MKRRKRWFAMNNLGKTRRHAGRPGAVERAKKAMESRGQPKLTKAQWQRLKTETCGVRFWQSLDVLLVLGLVRRVTNDERNAAGRAGRYQGPLAATVAGLAALEKASLKRGAE